MTRRFLVRMCTTCWRHAELIEDFCRRIGRKSRLCEIRRRHFSRKYRSRCVEFGWAKWRTQVSFALCPLAYLVIDPVMWRFHGEVKARRNLDVAAPRLESNADRLTDRRLSCSNYSLCRCRFV